MIITLKSEKMQNFLLKTVKNALSKQKKRKISILNLRIQQFSSCRSCYYLKPFVIRFNTYFLGNESIHLLYKLLIACDAWQWPDFDTIINGQVFNQVLGAPPGDTIDFQMTCGQINSFHLQKPNHTWRNKATKIKPQSKSKSR